MKIFADYYANEIATLAEIRTGMMGRTAVKKWGENKRASMLLL